METRNRCKACRFKRCMEQGMAMESVKMGRIPKKVKERALQNYQKYQDRKSEQTSDDIDDPEIDDYSLSSTKRESISSSSSSTSSMTTRQSIDSNQDIIVIPDSKYIDTN